MHPVRCCGTASEVAGRSTLSLTVLHARASRYGSTRTLHDVCTPPTTEPPPPLRRRRPAARMHMVRAGGGPSVTPGRAAASPGTTRCACFWQPAGVFQAAWTGRGLGRFGSASSPAPARPPLPAPPLLRPSLKGPAGMRCRAVAPPPSCRPSRSRRSRRRSFRSFVAPCTSDPRLLQMPRCSARKPRGIASRGRGRPSTVGSSSMLRLAGCSRTNLLCCRLGVCRCWRSRNLRLSQAPRDFASSKTRTSSSMPRPVGRPGSKARRNWARRWKRMLRPTTAGSG
mmetsp:Transcript_81215/g.263269  ORF Transcript_81215/g.263269 Transcript_81215/m.263269 type:complete len:283 (+) Transcript_81215:1050-1898(+)